MTYHDLLSTLPVRPGDTVYIVWEDEGSWRLTAEHVLYVLFDKEEQLLIKVNDATDEVIPFDDDLLFTSFTDAVERYSDLNRGVVPPPVESRRVDIVLGEPLRAVKGRYVLATDTFYDEDGEPVEYADIRAWMS